MLTPEQIEARRKGIGASDAAAVLGFDPYKTALDIYRDKLGIAEQEERSPERQEAIDIGNRVEEPLINWIGAELGEGVYRTQEMFKHPDHEWMFCHIDGGILGKPEGIETKARGCSAKRNYGRKCSDDVYTPDLIQCQHIMAVKGWERMHLVVRFKKPDSAYTSYDARHYVIERNETLIKAIIEKEHAFWHENVLKQVEPRS